MTKVLRGRLAEDRGTTILEVTMVVFLLGIVLMMVLGGVGSIQRGITTGSRRLENLDEARVLMDVLSKDLRTATRLSADTSAFTLASDREAIFYGNIDPTTGPNLLHVYVDASNALIEQRTAPDPNSGPNYTYKTQPTKTRFIGQFIANAASQPIFTYYDSKDQLLTPTPLSADNMLAIDALTITLSVKKSTSLPVPATTLVNRVSFPNLDYNPLSGG